MSKKSVSFIKGDISSILLIPTKEEFKEMSKIPDNTQIDSTPIKVQQCSFNYLLYGFIIFIIFIIIYKIVNIKKQNNTESNAEQNNNIENIEKEN